MPQPSAVSEPTLFKCHPLNTSLRFAGVVIFVLAMLSPLIHVERFGASPGYKIRADQARASADAFLRQHGMETSGYRNVVFPATHWGGDDALAGKYILERRSTRAASELFERDRPLQHWLVRYYRSLDKEEAVVSVHPETGKVLSFEHTIPEDRPGADIASERARVIAVAFASAMGWDLGAMDLKESSSEKMKARRDHTLVWEARPGDPRNVDEAHFRVTVEVAGDQVVALRSAWKIPEDYARARSRRNALSIALFTLRIAFGSLLGGAGLWLLIQRIRKGLVNWRPAIRLAIPVTLLALLGQLLTIQLAFKAYDSAVPLLTFKATMLIGVAISLIFSFLMYIAMSGLLTSFYPESLASLRAAGRKSCGADAVVATLLAIGFAVLLNRLHTLLLDRFHTRALYAIGSPDVIVSAAPAISVIASALGSALLYAAGLAVIVQLVAMLPKRWIAIPVGLLAAAAFAAGDTRTLGEFALQYGMALAGLVCAAVFCLYFARHNYLAYALAFFAVSVLRNGMMQLLAQPNPVLQVQGWIVVVVLAAALVWAVLPAMRRAPGGAV